MIVEERPAELAAPVAPEPARMDPRPAPAPRQPRFTTGALRWRSPVPRHRRLGLPGAASVLGALVLLVAVVVVGDRVIDSQLDADERFREFVTSGQLGEPVSARTVEVTVLGVRSATVIGDGEFLHDTDGEWLLVWVRAVAVRESTSIGYAAVRDAQGRVSNATDRVDQPLVDFSYTLQPGVPVEGEVVFEVPKDATGLTVRLADSGTDLRLTAVAEIALPDDVEPVDEPPTLEEPQVVIADQPVLDGDPDSGE